MFAIGHRVVFSLAGWCRLIQAGFLRPRPTQDTTTNVYDYAYRAFTFCGRSFQVRSTCHKRQLLWSYNPAAQWTAVWALPGSLATTSGITIVFFSCSYLDGSVQSVRPPITRGPGGYPIRKSTDHSFFAAPRGLSQLCTSFFASRCQGIHHVPFGAFVFWPAHDPVQRPGPNAVA